MSADVAPVARVVVPEAEQVVHVDVPPADHVPARHATHVEKAPPPPAVPAGQGVQAVAPSAENVPGAHVPEQELVVRPVAAPNFPAGQFVQVPPAKENFP